jgi:hypothetical protein
MNEELVKLLENLLARAKTGEVVGIAAAVQLDDGGATSPYAGALREGIIVGRLMRHVVRLSSEG